MSKLIIFDYFVEVEEREKNVIRGILRCFCGNDYFKIYYYGKCIKGIFFLEIIRLNKRIVFLVYCELCDKLYGIDNYNLFKI